ncbi:succinate dehydrogenase [Thermodesulfovibrio aggregans]|uniref:Succinate dehydrogenase cytochrome b556 subunit n=1 Tax=Thermodesulfovibrio aggregans TaxID=86166 RepID=A0A0U9HL88_9BACT|nr:succinate dehydrogenase, hydrophobic membrane anchor protein [Thermodesulfovibrio aggregans]GAQ93886.1 succinate dehydrogenase [Thermodesulfovibrio aggregans]
MWSWLLHRITGVILVVGLLYHFVLMHFMGHDNYSYEAVMQRLSDPSWKIFNIVFLISALYHGFYGLNGLVLEYIKSDSLKKFLKIMIFVIPVALAFWGVKIVFLL